MFKRLLYRPVQRLLHHFHLHYMPPTFPEGDVLLWCRWCGVRYVAKRHVGELRGSFLG